jgi:CDP-diacylglycerol pyrophosphatase
MRPYPPYARTGLAIPATLLLALFFFSPSLKGQSNCPKTRLFPVIQTCLTADSAKCAFVDAKQGYAILKDLKGETQLLLVATQERCGIEDPRIEAPDEPNYFEEAWDARQCVSDLAGRKLADSEISLAINSVSGRSDGQLHIHIDLLNPDLLKELKNHPPSLTFNGHTYSVTHYDTLAGKNLFADLQNKLKADSSAAAMRDQTLVVVGDSAGGFYVLNDYAHGLDRASGEELQIPHAPLPPDQHAALASKAQTCLRNHAQ